MSAIKPETKRAGLAMAKFRCQIIWFTYRTTKKIDNTGRMQLVVPTTVFSF